MAGNERTNVKIYPTALATDILFYVLADSTLPKNRNPEYGTPYRDCLPHAAENFPDHKLVFISADDGSGKQKWYFAADRANQDAYNYELSGGEQLVRTYVIPRGDYLEYSYAQWVGAGSDPAKWSYPPAGVDGTGAVGARTRSRDNVFTEYAFADDTLRRVEREFDSLYVTIQRRFIRPVTVQQQFDAGLKRNVTITTTVIPATPAVTATSSGGVTTEIKDVNMFHSLKIETEIDATNDPLEGQRAYVERQVVDVSERIVAGGAAAPSGLLVASSSVSPRGDGNSVEESMTVDEWVEHTEVDWNTELMGHVSRTEKFVDPAEAATPATLSSYKIVNEHRSLRITEIVPTDALDNFVISYPVRVSLDLPRVLKSIDVVWNASSDVGTRSNNFSNTVSGTDWSLSGDNADAANSSVGLNPEVRIEFEDYSSNGLMGTAYFFFLPLPVTTASILAKVSALAGAPAQLWPVFKLKAHTLVTMGQSASVRVQTNASTHAASRDGGIYKSGWQYGYTDDISKNLSNGVVQIPPCIHGDITLGGETTKTAAVAAYASSPIYTTYSAPLTPSKTATATVHGSVSPSSFEATSPASIPTEGIYLLDSQISPYEYNYAKVRAEVFDASSLA